MAVATEKLTPRQKFIKGLVSELCAMPAQDTSGLLEPSEIRQMLGRALDECGKSEDHMRRAVFALMSSKWRPTAMEVRAALQDTPEESPAAAGKPDPECARCGGTGVVFCGLVAIPGNGRMTHRHFDTEEEAIAAAPALRGTAYSNSKDCPCKRGGA